jgi:valyl-tRNA synthetase
VVPADGDQAAALELLHSQICTLAGLERLDLMPSRDPRPGEQRLVAAGATIALPLAGVVDVAAAAADLDRQINRLRADVDKTGRKLADDSFVTRAPAHVVEEMRRRDATAREALATLIGQRAHLGSV